MRKSLPFILLMFVCNGFVWSQTWEQLVKVVPANRAASDNFGRSVSISGNFAIVGANREDEDATDSNTKPDAGSVDIFYYNGTTWVLQQKLAASDRAASDYFGYSVSISGDYAIVGAVQEDEDASGSNTLSNAGSAYIFHYNGSTWEETQKLVSSDRAASDYFGTSVAISGNYAVIGASFESEDQNQTNTVSGAGSAYIFKLEEGNWTQMQKIVGINRFTNSRFGIAVASFDSLIAVGSFNCYDPSGANQLFNAGAAYVFKLTGSTWTMQQKIVPASRLADDNFGCSVALSGDYLLVGAFKEDEDVNEAGTLTDAGSAYVFHWNGSVWEQQQKIVASDRAAGDNFGYSVSISEPYALVGAYKEMEDALGQNSLTSAGSAYLYELGLTGWTQLQKLVPAVRAASDFFGFAVSMGSSTALVGAYQEDEDASEGNTVSAAGSAYFFTEVIAEDPIKNHLLINDSTILAGETVCFNAYDTITLAGNNDTVAFDNLSSVTLIAGRSIRFLPGFHAQSGCYLDAHITSDSTFCEPVAKSLLLTGNPAQTPATQSAENRPGQLVKDVKIYPNPTTGRFDLLLSNFEGTTRIIVTNASGRVVARLEGNNLSRQSFDLSAMNKGLYLIHLVNGTERLTRKVLVR